MASCSAKYVLKNCMCLTDPFDAYSNVCGYIDKMSGRMYSCDPGCCLNTCQSTLPKEVIDLEIRQSSGTALPPGYGDNLPKTTDIVNPVGSVIPPDSKPPPYPTWIVILIAFAPLLVAFALSFMS